MSREDILQEASCMQFTATTWSVTGLGKVKTRGCYVASRGNKLIIPRAPKPPTNLAPLCFAWFATLVGGIRGSWLESLYWNVV